MPTPPSLSTSSAVEVIEPGRSLSPRRRVLPVKYTVQPASPSPRAMPLPIPRLDPVTTATFPFRELGKVCPARLQERKQASKEMFWPTEPQRAARMTRYHPIDWCVLLDKNRVGGRANHGPCLERLN